jgi:protein arginine kinase activator
MLCGECHEKKAVFHYTEIINGEFTELHLCEACAEEKGLGVINFPSPFSLANLLSGLVEPEEAVEPALVPLEGCKACGMTYEDFKKIGKLGCGGCYKMFKDHLVKILRRIHGNITHIGKTIRAAEKVVSREDELSRLKRELEQAVQEERYEDAAILRDKIRNIQKLEKK